MASVCAGILLSDHFQTVANCGHTGELTDPKSIQVAFWLSHQSVQIGEHLCVAFAILLLLDNILSINYSITMTYIASHQSIMGATDSREARVILDLYPMRV